MPQPRAGMASHYGVSNGDGSRYGLLNQCVSLSDAWREEVFLNVPSLRRCLTP